MALIVEDGSIVTGANSFVTVSEIEDHAESIGTSISGDVEQMALKAIDYIKQQEDKLKGYRFTRDQPLPYPRSGLVIEGWHWASDEIPRQVKSLQINLVLDIDSGVDLYNRPEPSNKIVKRERIEGALEVEYAVGNGSVMRTSSNSASQAILAVLSKSNGLTLVRT